MSSDPKNPKSGELVIDASSLAPFIVDLAPGERQGMRTEQPGLSEVLDEISANQPTLGVEIGIGDKLISNLKDYGMKIDEIDKFLPAARKLVELLEESRAKLDDSRYHIISTIAAFTDKLNEPGSVDLTAAYEKTRAYRSAIGLKAAKTREKNLQQAANSGENG